MRLQTVKLRCKDTAETAAQEEEWRAKRQGGSFNSRLEEETD